MGLRIVLGLIALAIAWAMADEAVAGGRKGDRAIERLDRDGDGYISQSELEAYRGGRFEELDRDGDGTVSRDEMMERIMRRMEREFGPRFDALDANRDGRIDRNEYGGRSGRFDRLDRDGDGRISIDELKRGKRK